MTDFADLFANFSPASNSLKTDMFVRISHMNALNKLLRQVASLPPKQKQKWLRENSSFLEQFAQDFMQDSTLALQGVSGDKQEVKLSIEYVSNLREVMQVVGSLLYTDHRGSK